MKTMKYRSIFATFTAVALSVFLFTSCEKESDGIGGSQGDRLEKFKRLQFSTGSASSSTNNGSGTFIGNGGNISFVPPGGGAATFAPSAGNDKGFTDIGSTGPTFAVENPFGFGGGSVTFDGESYNLALGFCADYNFSDSAASNQDERDINIFIGMGGDIDLEDLDGQNFKPDFTIFVWSFNGATDLADYHVFNETKNGQDVNGAFLLVVKEGVNEFGDTTQITYFATQGSVVFAGSQVVISDAVLTDVDDIQSDGQYGANPIRMAAQLECVNYSDVAGE